MEDNAGESCAISQYESIVETLEKFYELSREEFGGDPEEVDELKRYIHEQLISVEVRSGWAKAGDPLEPYEFQILLCYGGPSVRLFGRLDVHNQPIDATLEWQHWGTSWTRLSGVDCDKLKRYAEIIIAPFYI